MSLSEIQRILRNLLRERIPVRDLPNALEFITDAGSLTHDVNALTETPRFALSRTTWTLANEYSVLEVLTLDSHPKRPFAD